LILLAGRFRGKRVVLLKNLAQGVLLVTGPFKVNGVPLRRVNARYVIATSTKVDISGIDSSVVEKVGGDAYFAREKKSKAKGEDAFFKQGEKPEVRSLRQKESIATCQILIQPPQAKKVASGRAEDQKSVDRAILSSLKKEPFLISYLGSTFSLRSGDKPHEMVF
jgi:large subunit ribosomal protein L6e